MPRIDPASKGKPTSTDRINAFERRNGLVLGDAYRRFLLESNGGAPTSDRLVVPSWRGKSTSLARFFGLETGGDDDLEAVLRNVEDYLPAGYLPIAEDSGGNLVCLGAVSDHVGKIYFWDHEDPAAVDSAGLILIAADVDALLAGLLPPDTFQDF